MRSIFATEDLFAISALNRETAINTEQTLDTVFRIDLGALPKFERRRETDADEATGHEEITKLYDLGNLASIPISISKCLPMHVACFGTYALGSRSTAAAGTGYKHTITPITGDLEAARSNPSFTYAFRHGLWLLKQRFASGFVDSLGLTFDRDKFLKLDSAINATGKRTTNMVEESITAAYNAESLTLAANGVAGGSGAGNAQNRLDNIHHIRVQVPSTLQWVDVVYSAVSDASPAVITIVAPGGVATSTTYKVLYNIKEADTYAWCDFSGLDCYDPDDSDSESPLRTTDFSVTLGGKWNGSAFVGGKAISADINSMKWNFNHQITPEYTCGAASGDYANRALREGREQTLDFDRKYRDYIIGNFCDTMETFGFYALAEGDVYDSPHKFTVEMIFPKVAVMSQDPKLSGKRLDEDAKIVVMADSTYGSVILNVKNKVATYAA